LIIIMNRLSKIVTQVSKTQRFNNPCQIAINKVALNRLCSSSK